MSRAIVVLYIVSVSAVFCMYHKKAFGKSKPVPNPWLPDNNTLNNTTLTFIRLYGPYTYRWSVLAAWTFFLQFDHVTKILFDICH